MQSEEFPESNVGSHFVSDPDGVRYESDPAVPVVAENVTAEQDRASAAPSEVAPNGRIVVGVDGSESSLAALERAVKIADALGSSIEVICCWNFPAGYGSYNLEEYSPEKDAIDILNTVETTVFGGGRPKNVTSTTRQGAAASVLIEASEGAEMLVVGSRGHGGIAGLLLGSVSSSCAEHAHCPVLVMR